MADKKKKKPASLGCLFWIAFILLVIVLFFFNKKNITGVLEKTGAAELFSHIKTTTEKTATGIEPVVPLIKTADEPLAVSTPASGDGSKEKEPETAVKAPAVKTPAAETVKPASKTATSTTTAPAVKTPAVKTPTAETVKPAAKEPVTGAATEKPVPTRKATLFFVTIDADGRVLRKEVVRDITQTDSPLSETLVTLFKGTNGTESGKGLRSLIPQGTRLLSATVKDGVAMLNLSEEFQFNQYGIEGYLGQLSQIVFTATAFSTVKSVQFLIDGQRREYLGAEGVWIGTPLSRDKF